MNSIHDTPFGSFVWFLGVVEDVVDPEGLNRVRVRCVGFHSEDRSLVPHDMLPWAGFLNGSSAMSGPMVLPGDWVVGFFLDGIDGQQPVVMGSMVGVPTEKGDKASGFTDPSGVYPKNVGQPTNSALARGKDTEDGLVAWKKGSLAPGEPSTPFAAVYPQNHVLETDGRNIIELDDTPGAERVHIFHKSGTFYEVHPDGTLVVRSVADSYEAVIKDKTLYVAGALKIQCVGDANITTNGDMTLGAGGDVNIAAGGDVNIGAGGSISVVGSGVTEINGSTVKNGEGSNKAGSPETVATVSSKPFVSK